MDFKKNFVIHSFPEIVLELNPKGQWKKIPKGMRKGWQKLTETSIKKNDTAFGLLTGEISNILVLDFDDINLFDNYCMKFPEIINAPRVSTRKGFHVYYKWKNEYTTLPSNKGKLDIQGNGKQVFYVGTNYKTEVGDTFEYKWFNDVDIGDLPDDLFVQLKYFKEGEVVEQIVAGKIYEQTEEKEIVVAPMPTNNLNLKCNNKLWNDIINNIDIKYIEDYRSWFHLVCSIYSLGKTFDELDHYKEVARHLSMKSKKYDITHKEFEKMWESCHNYRYTPASIRHYSRESSETNYINICKKHSFQFSQFYSFDEKVLCDYIIELIGDNLVCNFGKIYIYHNSNWYEDSKGCIIQKWIKEKLTELYHILIDDLHNELKSIPIKKTEERKLLLSQIEQTCSTLRTLGHQKVKNIWGFLHNELISQNLDYDLFDTRGDLFVFKNKAFDLINYKFVKIDKFDYILTTCSKEFIEPTPEQINTIKTLFIDIFPNPEYRKAYISVLKSGMSGIRQEKFLCATGGGRNGKGVINDLFKFLLGDYYGILHLTLLTKELKGGANTELRGLHKKRFLKATEPDSGSTEKLRMSNIKALTGESELKARGLYENDTNIMINATFLLECNKLPHITMDGNEAEKQRMAIIPFETTFTFNKDDVEKYDDYKLANSIYKTADFYNNHYCALFMYLVNNYKEDDIYLPEACQKLATKWLLSKDDFVGWFFENYEEDDNTNNIISVKTIYKNFKESSFFSSLSKSQQRQNNEKAFKEMIQGKLKWAFVPCHTYIEKKHIQKDSIKGYRKRIEVDSDDDEV